VAINKIDLYGPEHRDLEELRKALEERGAESFPISALTGEGLEKLKGEILQRWEASKEA